MTTAAAPERSVPDARGAARVAGSRERAGDRLFRLLLTGAAGLILLAALALAWQLGSASRAT